MSCCETENHGVPGSSPGPATEVLTVEYKINFLAPAWGQKMVARGEVLTAGRRLFVCKAEVVAAISGEGEETPCAALQQTIATAPAENK